MSDDLRSRRILALILILIAGVLYVDTLGFQFAFDDVLQVTHSPLVNNDLGLIDGLRRILTSPTPPGNLYRPLTLASLFLTAKLVGMSPFLFHLENVLLFLCCILTLWTALRPVLPSLSLRFSVLLLYSLHPVHTEVVANVVGRAEMLALLCAVGAMILFARFTEREQEGFFSLIGASLLFWCAICSKESAYTFLAIIPLYCHLRSDLHFRNFLSRKSTAGLGGALLVVVLASLIIRMQVLGEQFVIPIRTQTFVENPLAHLNFLERLFPALVVLGKYVAQLLVPFHQSAEYSQTVQSFFAEAYSFKGVLLVLLALAPAGLGWLVRKQIPLFWVAWFYLSFSVSLNIVSPGPTIRGDRLLFTPSLGLICFVMCVLWQAFKNEARRNKIWCPTVAVLAACFAYLSAQRIPVWKDHASIFSATVIDSPQSPRAAFNLGLHYYIREKEPAEAELWFRRALELEPDYFLAARFLIETSRMQGRLREMDYWASRALLIDPGNKEVRALQRSIRAAMKRKAD